MLAMPGLNINTKKTSYITLALRQNINELKNNYFFKGKPTDNSLWLTTSLGDIFIWNPSNTNHPTLNHVYELDLSGKDLPLNVPLHTGCTPGTIITIFGCISDDADRIAFNLNSASTFKQRHKTHTELHNCLLHINPRVKDDITVRNTMTDGSWGEEERSGNNPFKKGQEFCLRILCTPDDYMIFVDNDVFCKYRHRVPCSLATDLEIWGKLQLFKLKLESPDVILNPKDMFFQQVGGHLRRVESCDSGVTWGIGYDKTAWVYSGGWGGGFMGTLDSSNVFPMTGVQNYR